MLLGYGKMGKAIEKVARERDHDIPYKIDKDNYGDLEEVTKSEVDAVIEFSEPGSAVKNIKWAIKKQIPIVSGTTGWLEKKPEIAQYCHEHKGTFLHASNFSLGVNIFFRLNEFLANIMNRFDQYDVSIEEIHHTEKLDAPSGTAIKLAEGIIEYLDRKNKWVNSDASSPREIGIRSLREKDVAGTHTISYHSKVDDIDLKHTAHSREGFALGAVMVAEWIRDKRGVFEMKDFMNF